MESKIFARLNFDPGILVILSFILVLIIFFLMIWLMIRQSRLEMNYKIFMRGRGGKSLQEIFRQEMDNVAIIKEQTELMHKRLMYVEKSLGKSYQKCGIVKYDAFKELGGKLSFAYAMLNDSNTGFVLNCIHSREGSYTYIKDVVRGECELPLCEEEEEAIRKAISSSVQRVKAQNREEARKNNPKTMSIRERIAARKAAAKDAAANGNDVNSPAEAAEGMAKEQANTVTTEADSAAVSEEKQAS